MNRANLFDGFYFNNHSLFYKQVYSVSRLQFHLLVADRKGDLPLSLACS